MESKRKKEKKREVTGSETSSLAGNGSRWQPTREQIEILESVYSAGVKTPSAEQIQQITARLSAYGHIEGKNVFYWFQNTKARRRQKQKQDRLAYLTRFYHHSPPLFAPTYGVVSEAAGFYYYPCGEVDKAVEPRRWGPRECKTLELFPLQPSGRGGVADSYSNYSSVQTNDEYSTCKDVAQGGFIDFFSGNCSSSATETD